MRKISIKAPRSRLLPAWLAKTGLMLSVAACLATLTLSPMVEAAGSHHSKPKATSSSKKSSSSAKSSKSAKTGSKKAAPKKAKKGGARSSGEVSRKGKKVRRVRDLPPSVPIEELRAPSSRAWPRENDPELALSKVALRKQYLVARDAFNRRDYDAAVQRFTGLIDTYPALHDYILRDLSRSILAGGETQGLSRTAAESLLQGADSMLAVPGTTQEGWGQYIRARALQSLGRLEEAETAYSRALAIPTGPPKDAVYYYMGTLFEDSGRPGDAYVDYVFATQMGIGSYRARASEAAARVGEKLDPAERGVDWVLRRDELARLVRKGADREALKMIQQARQECSVPDIKDDLRRLEGFCYLGLARHDQAADLLLNLMDDELNGGRPNWDTIAALQKAMGKRGDRATRMNILSRFIASHPPEEGAEAYFIMASLLKDDGREADAETLYQEVANRYPKRQEALEARWLLSWGRIRRNQPGPAVEALKALVARVPAESDDEARARYWLARLLVQTGKAPEGMEMFADVNRRFPDSYYGAMAGWQLKGGFPKAVWTPDPGLPPMMSDLPGDEPAALGLALLFPGFDEKLALVKDPPSASRLDKAKELWLMGLNGEAYLELDALTSDPKSSSQARWMAAALSHSMGGMLHGIKYAHRYLIHTGPDEVMLPERQALAFPIPYRDAIVRHSAARGVDPALVAALIQQESTFRADIGSPVGARGLMQIMPYTGAEVAGWLDIQHYNSRYLTSPDFNLRLGTEYLRAMLTKFNGSLVRTLASYNAGPAAVARWVKRLGDLDDDYLAEEIPFKETRAYVRLVLRNFQGYSSTYRPGGIVPRAPVAAEQTEARIDNAGKGSNVVGPGLEETLSILPPGGQATRKATVDPGQAPPALTRPDPAAVHVKEREASAPPLEPGSEEPPLSIEPSRDGT